MILRFFFWLSAQRSLLLVLRVLNVLLGTDLGFAPCKCLKPCTFFSFSEVEVFIKFNPPEFTCLLMGVLLDILSQRLCLTFVFF